MFDAYDFDRMNETDVREAIVAPVLRELGYRHSSPNDIITELSLRYPNQFIGRKKPSDPILRGKADYVLEVDRRLRWVIEVTCGSQKGQVLVFDIFSSAAGNEADGLRNRLFRLTRMRPRGLAHPAAARRSARFTPGQTKNALAHGLKSVGIVRCILFSPS